MHCYLSHLSQALRYTNHSPAVWHYYWFGTFCQCWRIWILIALTGFLNRLQISPNLACETEIVGNFKNTRPLRFATYLFFFWGGGHPHLQPFCILSGTIFYGVVCVKYSGIMMRFLIQFCLKLWIEVVLL